jgi:23S rRNA (uracil1939-C5)-methyltransferase
VGRHNGLVVFVPGTAPQDLARVRITSKKAKFWEGELVELIKPSPLRREPPCPVADRCGGCSWQHVTYAGQVEEKQKILAASLRPVAKLTKWEWLPVKGAPEEFHYRNRIQVQIRGGKKGFFAKRSHDLVETSTCLIAEDSINRQLQALVPDPGATRIELRTDSGSDFAQVNDRQNEKLKEMVLGRAGASSWIMDLYSGSGNITFPLAGKFPGIPVLAVDLSATAIAAARAKGSALPQIEWVADDVEKALAREKNRTGDGLIVLDPPRIGCTPGVIAQIQRLSPKQIIYVSCNPTTFARDCVKLLEGGRFRLESVQGLDMFPQTEHVELVASLCAATELVHVPPL